MAIAKLYVNGVLTTLTNVTIDATHPVVLQELEEETEWDLDATNDAEANEITTFIGISPKR